MITLKEAETPEEISDLTIERSFDDNEIRQIMTFDSIWQTCAEDGQTKEDYKPDTIADCWLILKCNDGIVGAYNIHPHNKVTIEIHAHILPIYRKQYSLESGDLALKWILEKGPKQYQKVIAQVPSLYQNVIDFTIAHGFKIEGINRLSDSINGILYDQILLGITRKEIEEYLNAK